MLRARLTLAVKTVENSDRGRLPSCACGELVALRYKPDRSGRSQLVPVDFAKQVLLKIVLLGYSRGLISSRRMAAACRENVVFIALSRSKMPHFTTLAGFVADAESILRRSC